jgi:predicted nucleic acid-binding protein
LSAYADTSFLYSLYVQQAHSAAAAVHMASTKDQPLPITSLNRFELCNAIRLSVFRKLLDRRMAAADLKIVEKDITAGVLTLMPCDWAAVHAKAEELSSERTFKAGHRAMDLLHVASALTLGVSDFLTFDQNQAELASLSGLTVKP